MPEVNKDVKTLLAKLLATENIHVVHKNMETAYFDTKNRELGLPILENMSGDIYDLMTLHEVGHALWTDPEEWSEIVSADNDDDLPKSFINVTEDVRIERKIKDKYPGGRLAFRRGYEDLFKRDFFNTSRDSDLNQRNLADKINLHSKIGDITGITFDGEEKRIYDLCNSAVTFQDAIAAARAIYEYVKENNEDDFEDSDFDWHSNMSSSFDADGDDSDDLDMGMRGQSEMDMEFGDDGEDSESESQESEDGESAESGSNGTPSEESDSDGEPNESKIPSAKKREGGFGMGETTNSIQANTVLDWEDRKRDLNCTTGKDYWYTNVPETNENSIIDYKFLIDYLSKYYSNDDWSNWMNASLKYTNDFEKESMKAVTYMLKEFEMKKSADAYQRATVSKTGTLDMLKIHSFKYNDDLFKKVTMVPEGKNHGLVMYLDWSGSMTGQIHDALKQILQLVWFCKRAGIKFEVFAFSDGVGYSQLKDTLQRRRWVKGELTSDSVWNLKEGDMFESEHHLLNLLSSRMSKIELKRMTHYLMTLTSTLCYRGYYWDDGCQIPRYLEKTENWRWNQPGVPDGLNLSGTPLNACILNAMNFIPEYRSRNKIQNLNVVFVTDGASNHCSYRYKEGDRDYDYEPSFSDANIMFVDPITKKQFRLNDYGRDCMSRTNILIDMLKDRTQCNILGFYITGSNTIKRQDMWWLFPNDNHDEIRRGFRKNKFAISESCGYDDYYVIPGGSALNTSTDELGVTSDMTKGKMAKAFAKHMKSKVINRVLLNKFVEKVA